MMYYDSTHVFLKNMRVTYHTSMCACCHLCNMTWEVWNRRAVEPRIASNLIELMEGMLPNWKLIDFVALCSLKLYAEKKVAFFGHFH